MVKFTCDYPIIHKNGTRVGNSIFANFFPNMPPEWGGYILMSATSKWLTDLIYKDGLAWSTLLFLNHFFDYESPSRSYIDSIFNFGGLARFCFYENVSSFWEYEKNVTDTIYKRNVILGTLMQKNSFSDKWVDFVIDFVLRAYYQQWIAVTSSSGILLGGKKSFIVKLINNLSSYWILLQRHNTLFHIYFVSLRHG